MTKSHSQLTQVSRQKRVSGQNAPKLVFAVKLGLVYVGTDGFYWTSTPDGDTSAYYVWIGMGAAGIFDDGKLVDNYRQMGHSVRPFADHL